MSPRVSVIMTVRNGARYLPETLDALAAQTLSDYELVINDNGSVDATPSILAAWAGRDARIRVLPRLPLGNRTFTQGIRRAFEAATAPLVAINDSDDVSAPDRLAQQVAVLQARPEVVLVGSWYDQIDHTGQRIDRRQPPTDVFSAYQSGNPIAHSSVMVRRDKAIAAGGYRERYIYASDFALQIALARAGGQVAMVPEPLIRIRIHDGQASRMPGQLVQFYREPLEIISAASRLPGVPWQARLQGMAARQKLALRYGQALWNDRHLAKSLAETSYWLLASLTSLIPHSVAGGERSL